LHLSVEILFLIIPGWSSSSFPLWFFLNLPTLLFKLKGRKIISSSFEPRSAFSNVSHLKACIFKCFSIVIYMTYFFKFNTLIIHTRHHILDGIPVNIHSSQEHYHFFKLIKSLVLPSYTWYSSELTRVILIFIAILIYLSSIFLI